MERPRQTLLMGRIGLSGVQPQRRRSTTVGSFCGREPVGPLVTTLYLTDRITSTAMASLVSRGESRGRWTIDPGHCNIVPRSSWSIMGGSVYFSCMIAWLQGNPKCPRNPCRYPLEQLSTPNVKP